MILFMKLSSRFDFSMLFLKQLGNSLVAALRDNIKKKNPRLKVSQQLNFLPCQNQNLLTFRARVNYLIQHKKWQFRPMSGWPFNAPHYALCTSISQPSGASCIESLTTAHSTLLHSSTNKGVNCDQDFSDMDTCSLEVLHKHKVTNYH